MTLALLRLPTVMAKTGLSRSTIYARMSADRFPKPVSLGKRAIGWVETEVDDWVTEQIHSSRQGLKGGQHD